MEEKKNVVTKLPNPEVLRSPCEPQCKGCDKIYEGKEYPLPVCIAYVSPKAKHKLGCFLQSNREITAEEKKKINPIKWSKRGNR